MRTYPVPGPSPLRQGFTLVEVLVAVTVATLLLTVTCSTLIVCLKAEGMSGHIERMRAPLSVMQARAQLGMDLDATAQKLLPTWNINRTHGGQAIASSQLWQRWEISPGPEPSLRVAFALSHAEAE